MLVLCQMWLPSLFLEELPLCSLCPAHRAIVTGEADGEGKGLFKLTNRKLKSHMKFAVLWMRHEQGRYLRVQGCLSVTRTGPLRKLKPKLNIEEKHLKVTLLCKAMGIYGTENHFWGTHGTRQKATSQVLIVPSQPGQGENHGFDLWPMFPYLCRNDPSKIKAPPLNKQYHSPVSPLCSAEDQPWTHHLPMRHHRNPLKAVKDTAKGQQLRIKHTALLISNFSALDRKVRAGLWSWGVNVSRRRGWHRDRSCKQGVSSLCISFVNWNKPLNNIITAVWLTHTHPSLLCYCQRLFWLVTTPSISTLP